ncbi:unnamed protein product [Heligmosomoides polygyrus]|uniref:SET domain-containing protein n=2 Tax=Heligmosomoides polygyrus TaxID=6339 RepID=A0A183GGQ4_HELPZ|nr:unnamed protein product [Heligmosomoides polygyrus]
MLVLDLEPGEAIAGGSVFYDYRDEKAYCDREAKRIKAISCTVVRDDDWEANDRVVMAVRRRTDHGDMVAAINDKDSTFNYAVGY